MSLPSAGSNVVGRQKPRICSFPEYVSSTGGEAIELAAMAGLVLDPWQQFVLANSLGERADGKWAAPTVGLVVGRQNGKNAVLEARELVGLFLLGEEVVVHSAHEQATSSEHFRRLLSRIQGVPEFDRRILKAPQGKGAEAIELRGGQRILFKTRTGGGGRGFSVDLLVYDEAMILSAEAKAALVPTLAARSMEGNTQTWYAGSAVDQLNPKHDGVELARIRSEGIKGHPRIAYFEWSAEGDDPAAITTEAASDPEVWAQANPGLGIRISPEWIEHERSVELGGREFAVERLGVGDWPALTDEGAVIRVADWLALIDESAPGPHDLNPTFFALDINPDRSWASIAAAGLRLDGLSQLELVDRRRGTEWVKGRMHELVAGHKPLAIVCDKAGPAASLLHELTDLPVEVIAMDATEYAAACGLLQDAVDERTVRHLGTIELTQAIKGAAKRPLGDRWAWARKPSSADISPLVAVTLAHWGLAASGRSVREPVVVWA